ncbi:TPA: GntP family permease [Acinetobacter baumannii]|uniref:GntP family permease n=1 Tax=Acinetobacter baumannii TaxID=470 RepID=UPI001129EC08|nr:GntP family permease [Acinetobacter baumannii]EHU2205025.1 GntP family permease [Acinetobacter baumannii]EHU2221092.1 GntP family permease [Acinetobacter baumannii]EHU2393399.1 GntP family permease [Acinetobacter baumannii]EHU2599819.1 GntP family permease [Acinetobacter baumannii]EHU2789347.1 GntP family permease [Acinetobacter baumannii]
MSVFIALAALFVLMIAAYRGYSVILVAPLAALGAVLLTDPSAVAPAFTNLFMDKMVGFIKLYFPVFLLGAIFGKLIELSGYSRSIVGAIIKILGEKRAIPIIITICGLLTYGGVSLFVVVFAVYPFAAEMFRQSNIPKRLMPATIALGAFTFTMDAMPGSPQIQNIIPTTFFNTTSWAAPTLGIIGSLFIVITGIIYLESRRKKAQLAGEGYGDNPRNEPQTPADIKLVHPLIALSPLLLVGLVNLLLTHYIPHWYPSLFELQLAGMKDVVPVEIKKITAIWAVLGALCSGILCILIFSFKTIFIEFANGTKSAISGAILAAMNTGSEYGFGAIIAALPGFVIVAGSLQGISNPLLNEAITINILAGITGSSSGGMSIALGAMADQFVAAANSAGIPLEVLHRVASMAAGGMDTLPHNGAIITLLTVTGLTHREAYKDIFSITIIKIAASFLIIGVFYMTGWV